MRVLFTLWLILKTKVPILLLSYFLHKTPEKLWVLEKMLSVDIPLYEGLGNLEGAASSFMEGT